jgi:nicotinamidase-related amidase
MGNHDLVAALIQAKSAAPFNIDVQRTALLIIDAQRDFVRAGYPFARALEHVTPGVTNRYFQRAQGEAVPNLKKLQQFFRARRRPIVYTGTGTQTGDGTDLPCWLGEFDALGLAVLGHRVWPSPDEDAWQIGEDVRPEPGETVINKRASSAFADGTLDPSLRQAGIDAVVISGFTTDVCISSTARSAADAGYKLIVVSDACATLSRQMHDASLQAIALAFGRVFTTEQTLQHLSTQSFSAAS